jgi:hypothetical protein
MLVSEAYLLSRIFGHILILSRADPFNDDFERGGGFTPPLTEGDSIMYLYNISMEARYYGMAMGMKNAESILANVSSFIQFAVNEECTTYSAWDDGCWLYEPFLKSGKPVFHFEYVNITDNRNPQRPGIQSVYKDWANLNSEDLRAYYCMEKDFGFNYLPRPEIGRLFSTTIKKLDLGGWVMWCDGTTAETPTQQTVGGPDYERDPGWRGKSGGGRGAKDQTGPGQPELLQGGTIGRRSTTQQKVRRKEDLY